MKHLKLMDLMWIILTPERDMYSVLCDIHPLLLDSAAAELSKESEAEGKVRSSAFGLDEIQAHVGGGIG